MSLDNSIIKAVTEIVAQRGEKDSLSTAIINWVSAVHAGDTKLDDRDDVNRRIELLLEMLKNDH